MNWRHVQLIFQREMVDQLRDRRTLFTITILPILLYPFIGMLMMQIAQFKRDSQVQIRVVGNEHWPTDLPLFDDEGGLIVPPGMEQQSKLVEFEAKPWGSNTEEKLTESAKQAILASKTDLVLLIQPDFEEQLNRRLNRSNGNTDEEATETAADVESDEAPSDGLQIIGNLARDKSQIARRRLEAIIAAWQKRWVSMHLTDVGVSPDVFAPLLLTATDTSPTSVKRAMLWSKVLPFVMLIWALTGAFYPAIDLCAGEKERGTLETLLSSPARRREIVWGKLGAIGLFSISSALLNLVSMHVTAGIIVKQLASQGTPQIAEALGPMPFHAFGWLVLLLLPMAAFFSALALAVAALARSTKEGQYYLMPLLLVTLPLVAVPMMPSLELNLGTSLIPVSGAVFLVRALIEGRYTEALLHMPAVAFVTVVCCWMSIRWAIRQFENESVMFRESEKWNLRLWFHHLWRDREDTASPAEAVLCGVIILVAMFFAQFLGGASISTWGGIVKSTATVQIGLILTPCLLMATFLTRSMRRALRIHRVQPSHLAAAILLGVCMHPSYMLLAEGIQQIYQIGDETKAVLMQFQSMVMSQPLWAILLVMAIMPALCEEIAFRGFIFGGLLRQQGVLRAIVISALFFGFTHTVLQQSIAASIMGVVLGFIAWRTGGIICTIIVHAINNSLSLGLAWFAANAYAIPNSLSWALQNKEGSWTYEPTWVFMSIVLAIALMLIISSRSRETQKFVQAELA